MLTKHNFIQAFASKDKYRLGLQGVRFTSDGTIATNGHSCLWVSYADGAKFDGEDFTADLDGIKPGNGEVKNVGAIDGQTTAMLSLDFGGRTHILSPIDEKFPDIKKIQPEGEPLFCIRVNADLLAKSLKAVGSLCGRPYHTVEIEYFGKGKSLRISGDNGEQRAEALVMPLVGDDDG